MEKRLAGKVVIITGASTGIGKEAAFLFSENGAKVVIADINVVGGEKVAEMIRAKGNEAMFVATDVTRPEQVDAMVRQTLEKFGRVDVLYNNAAVNHFGKAADTSLEDWNRVFSINVTGVFLCCKSVIPAMQSQGGGAIVNTASSAGLVGLRNLAAYTASKGAVLQFTKNLALDYAVDHIRVNAICPGVTATEMTMQIIDDDPDPIAARARFDRVIPRGTMAEPIEIARVALFLASDEASYMTGAAVPVDGGYTAE